MPNCRFCNSELTKVFVSLGKTPLANSYLTAETLHQMEPFYPLDVFVCEKCFLVQLLEFEKPKDIFSVYAYFSSYSESWLAHSEKYVQYMIGRFGFDEKSLVVELGSNDGYLLQYFKGKNIPVLGVEPAKNVAQIAIENGIETHVAFFGTGFARDFVKKTKRPDLIIGNNILAHVPELDDFVAGMKVLLGDNGIITMEFPHLLRLINQNQFDTIYHEHFSYFSLLTAVKVFESHDLDIFDVEELPTHGGSLRIFAKHKGDESRPISDSIANLLNREIGAGLDKVDCYFAFGERVKGIKRGILDFFTKTKKEGKSIVGYGAPAKGNTLLNYCGIKPDLLDYTVDLNPYKQNKYLPGSHIPIYAPDRIKETKPDFVFILPWNLKDEIIDQISYVRKWGGKFVVPIPKIQVM